jgi:hypothetical protein
MISTRIALIMAVAAFAAGGFVMSPIPQAIAAVIATDVQCTGCIGTGDVAGNAITAAKIKDNEVKAAEIATDAVGASELKGVTKLIFAHCELTTGEATFVYTPGDFDGIDCSITGVDSSDTVVATLDKSSHCFHVEGAVAETDNVQVTVRNGCSTAQTIGLGSFIGIIVFDK